MLTSNPPLDDDEGGYIYTRCELMGPISQLRRREGFSAGLYVPGVDEDSRLAMETKLTGPEK